MTRSAVYEKSAKYYETRRAWYQANKARLLDEKARKRREDGDAMRARDRVWDRGNATRKHGISRTELEALYTRQRGRCAICETPGPMRGTGCLHIDHDHRTGERRGLLCFDCNRALVAIERQGPDWALRVLTYLGDPPLRRMRQGDGQALSHVGQKGATE